MLDQELPPEADLANWVKDALADYWGGPKLTNSPLMRLQVVRELAREHDDNPANALRALLRKAVDQVRPEGVGIAASFSEELITVECHMKSRISINVTTLTPLSLPKYLNE